ncbi:ABC transporter substrate-binding protein [uncultured Selenomonas sp.]|uniref:ABC transporter substrate-binding protein n=1 Tax=uncultured Selenomonas sp. TaxID=159275 RepID=UPI0025F86B9A|nr:ABC transporter substrate-binding protein [uncultured Selenomonas sp.]
MSSPQADTAGTAYEVTDVQGTVVSLPEKPHRILTLSMSTDEVVLGLVPPDHMVAVNSLLDDPVSSNVVPLAKEVEGRVTDPTVEEIAAMQPDLIIVPDWGDITRVASLRDLGIPVVVCKGARNLEEIEATVRLIAQAVGEPARGEKLVQKMDDKLAAITEQTSKIPDGEKKTVVLISLMSTYGGSGSSFDDACKYAGVINGRAQAGIRDGQAMSKYDVASFRSQYLDDPSLQTIRAIRDGRLEEPDEAYIYNCSQDFVFGVQEIAYRVYGDAFRQEAGQHLSAVDE